MASLPVSLPSISQTSTGSVHAHAHGRHGGGNFSSVTSLTDSEGSPATQSGAAAPAGSTQNLFSNLFDSLTQSLGSLPATAIKIATKL
jgi:hypothetical protein